MDVQMPNVSGIEATAAIRARESVHGGHQHIIAMTANAMQGDREACIAAGMDDYVSKPIQIPVLAAALARVPGPATTCEQAPAAAAPAPRPEQAHNVELAQPATAGAGFDRHGAVEQMGGDEELLREVVAAFLESCEDTVGRVQAAVRSGDCPALSRAAHTFKGSVATFCTGPVYELALRLERAGRDGRIDAARQDWSRLRGELDRLLPQLRALCASALAG